MVNNDFMQIFESFDSMFKNPPFSTKDVSKSCKEAANQVLQKNYPFYNIKTSKKNEDLIIEIALAGFSKDSLEIALEGNTLKVFAEKIEEDNEEFDYYTRQISKKSISREFTISEDYVNGDIVADFENGLLTVKISKLVKNAKKIVIN